LKRWVFKRFLKPAGDGADVTFCGCRVFDSPPEISGDRPSRKRSITADGWKTGAV